jgi:ADP-heptose:LPS heptosyltransferase
MQNSIFPEVRKIAVFRATALGDLIFALPALQALRDAYPQAELVYLGREWHAAFLPGRLPGPHRVIAVPPPRTAEQIQMGVVVDPEAEQEFLARMQAEAFDLAIQIHGAGEYSNPFLLSLAPRYTVGLKSPRAVPLDRWIPYVYYQNEVVRALEVVGLAGAGLASSQLLPRLHLLDSDRAEAAPIIESTRRPFAVIHPGSTDPRRTWSPQKYAEVGDFLAASGFAVFLTGTSIESGRVKAVEEAMRAPVTSLCGRLSLPGLAGLLSQAALFVGNDTGPLHLALGVGAKAVGLFWVEYLVNSLPLTRETFTPVIAWQRQCPDCGAFLTKAEADRPSAECPHERSLIEEITPADVIQGIEAVLASSG